MSSTSTPPSSTDILVIGGGPAGSYTAAALAREGFQVTLLERENFPRYHIGETMLPSMRSFLRFIDADDKVKNFGFAEKVGAALKLNQHKREGYTDFLPRGGQTFSVTRADFDDILLKHAVESGASVHEGVRVTEIKFSTENPEKPTSAEWQSDQGTGEIKFSWLVDASGRNGIMSTRYLKNRKFSENPALKNIATWSYWEGAGMYAPGTDRENAPWFEALTDETGWAWFIPLHNNITSVGVVISEVSSRVKKPQSTDAKAHYLSQLQLTPGLLELLGDARMVGDVKSGSDYSYRAGDDKYAGPNYRIVGDAGAFIDPLFSSGCHLAFTNATTAAATISASIRGHCTEEEVIQFHSKKGAVSYTRFLMVCLSVYKQIHAQESPVISDINEDNFDRAFEFIKPVIQGTADVEKVSESVLQSTLDFCSDTLAPLNPEMYERVAKRYPGLMALNGPPLEPQALADIIGDDEEAKEVMKEINAKKTLNKMYRDDHFGESLNGFSVVLKQGSLSLQRAN
ncbi:FAD/NAD P-binding domain-containing protein [Mycena venus]|uniref:FAD/NAD P-binding domain-containing protein n=1 Tax=Mycena venus TaxID=2733690 RepID=A0A8H7CVQ9_9AGAR|nr:FAD/NAD P-binding domain-containing protein [Mycena venus]